MEQERRMGRYCLLSGYRVSALQDEKDFGAGQW